MGRGEIVCTGQTQKRHPKASLVMRNMILVTCTVRTHCIHKLLRNPRPLNFIQTLRRPHPSLHIPPHHLQFLHRNRLAPPHILPIQRSKLRIHRLILRPTRQRLTQLASHLSSKHLILCAILDAGKKIPEHRSPMLAVEFSEEFGVEFFREGVAVPRESEGLVGGS